MKCPGQDMKYWKENAIFDVPCPKCQAAVEFYKDDTSRKCGKCGHRFVNPKMDFGCASYCQYAEQCIGTLPEEFSGTKDTLLKDKVAIEMKRHFQTDFRSIRQASSAAQFAENIGKTEDGANLAIILCAAYLHGTGLANARTILQKAGARKEMVEEICLLLAEKGQEGQGQPLSAQILHDALLLREMKEAWKEQPIQVEQKKAQLITASAKVIAASLLAE